MSCQDHQQQLLSVADPQQPPPSIQEHLDDCADCQDWQRRLLHIERHVPLLPIPPSRTKADYLRRLATGPDPRPLPARLRLLFQHRRVRQMTGLAAAVLLIALLRVTLPLAVGPPPPESPVYVPDPLLAQVLERNLRLAGANTPQERVEALAGLADDLHAETRLLANNANDEDLHALAQWFRQVVHEGIVKQAAELPPAQRPAVLTPIAEQLDRVSQAADQLAMNRSSETARALRAQAGAARIGQQQLHALLREETP
ncbi:MAG: hypothetical protein ACK4RK_01385 [Gemmataceae bacterium]